MVDKNIQRQKEAGDNLGKYYHEPLPDCVGIFKRQTQKLCSKKTLFKTFPILLWLPKYKWNHLLHDMIAGLTVGLTVIPQSIAYAIIANLPPQYGLYSSFMACFVYIIFGTSKDASIGPTAILSLMLQHYIHANPDYAVLMCFASGCIISACGVLKLGFLVRFISAPVTTGFTSAAAITIISGQVNNLLGIKSSSSEFLDSWINLFTNITETRMWDAILGIITTICLILLRQTRKVKGKARVYFKYLGLARNALAVIIGAGMAYAFEVHNMRPFKLTGDVVPGLPDVKPPPFTTVKNGTEISFSHMMEDLEASLITIPLISILEIIAIGKAFGKGKTIDASQELLALGLSNIASSFVQSMPVTASFSRSAVNNSSGVRTTLGGLFTGIVVIICIQFLTTSLYFIPKTVLAAVIIAATIFIVEIDHAVLVWRTKKVDVIPMVITFILCLFIGLEYGIISGILVNLMFILYNAVNPQMEITTEKIDDTEVLLVRPGEHLVYSSADYLRDKILKHVIQSDGSIRHVIIEGSQIKSIDATTAFNLNVLYKELSIDKSDLILWNWDRRTAGVVWRTNKDMQECFRNCDSLSDIFSSRFADDQSTDLSEIIDINS